MACGWRAFRRTFLLEDMVKMVDFYIDPRSPKNVYIEDITKHGGFSSLLANLNLTAFTQYLCVLVMCVIFLCVCLCSHTACLCIPKDTCLHYMYAYMFLCLYVRFGVGGL